MRYILLIAAFLMSSIAYGQGTWNKSSTNNAWNRTKADSVAIVPRDTSATNNAILPSTGQPVGDYGRIQAKHGLFYFHDSIRNRRMAFYDDLPGLGTFIQNQFILPQVASYLIEGRTRVVSDNAVSTPSNPLYEIELLSNRAGVTGQLISNTNKGGFAQYSVLGDSSGIGGSLSLNGREVVPDLANAFSQPNDFEITAGSGVSSITTRALNINGKIRNVIDTLLVTEINESQVIPGSKSLRFKSNRGIENDLEILNAGQFFAPGNSIHQIPSAIMRTDWTILATLNLLLDTSNLKYKVFDDTYPTAAMEVGLEGVTLHATRPGHEYFSDELHELIQARGNGVDGTPDLDTGKWVQAKVPIYMKYDSAQYAIVGDVAPWESTDYRPFIWQHSEVERLGRTWQLLDQHGSVNTSGVFTFRKSRGSLGSPSPIQNGDTIGVISMQSNDGSVYIEGASISALATATGSAGNVPTDILLSTGAGGTTERMRIKSNGNVGIGNTNPVTKLQVSGRTYFDPQSLGDASNPDLLVANAGSPSDFEIYSDASKTNIGPFSNTDLSFVTNGGTERVRLKNTGELGIGATIPTSKIDILGVNGYSQFRLRTQYTPTSSADANGNEGDIAVDDNFIYFKTSTGWKRSALTSF